MASITSTVGLASGIDSKAIIDQLMTLEAKPKLNILKRMDAENKKKLAYTDLQTRLTSVRMFGSTMKKPQSFRAAEVTTTDENVLTGTAGAGAAAGSYQMSVARLVTAQQSISRGFTNFDQTPVGAGTLTLELGGGDLSTPTTFEQLNGGAGARRGMFRITDRGGKSTIIDTTDAVTLDDVVRKINTSIDVSVRAVVKSDGIVLTDQSGQTLSNFRVEDVGDSHAAEDLGIKGDVALTTITGTKLGGLRANSSLASLNDGRGVGNVTGQPDIQITTSGGSPVDVNLDGATTLGDIITKINTALGSDGHAEIGASGKSIKIVDAGGGSISVAALNSSTAAADLGIVGSGTGSVDGVDVSAGINTTLVKSLRGGQGLNLGVVRIADRAGTTSDVDLTGASTVEQILDRINAATVNVTAEVRPGSNCITLSDKTGGTGNLVISDVSGTSGAEMGIVGTFAADAAHETINGANLQRAWFTGNTLLRDLNGGKGVQDGKFTISDSLGRTRTITVDNTKDQTVGDLMAKINATTSVFGVKASINANGDGLLFTDSAGGNLKMKIEEVNKGSSAKSLNIVGTATATTLDGSWEKTIAVTATDKLQDVQKKITDLNWGLSASVINDGSASNPYHLSLTSTNTGRAGRVTFDSGAVNLGERTLVEAQDAAVFVGSPSTSGTGAQPMLITASSNEVSGAIRGVTLKLTGVSKEPVTVNIARNVDNVVEAAGKFVESFNGLITQLETYTKYDSATNTRGELLGDSAANSIESELYGMLNTVGSTTGKYRIAADVGLRIGAEGAIEFDEQKFRAAYADDPDAVTNLFTRAGAAIDDEFQVSRLRNGQGVRATNGGADFAITTRDNTTFNVDVSDLTTMSQIIDAINDNATNNGKVVASINTAGTGIDLTDKSTGTKKFAVSTLNGSIAASDLGLLTNATGGVIKGRALIDPNSGDVGGIASIIEKRMNRLIDPTSGAVSRASKSVDDRNADFQERIDAIDKTVAAKRARLERQFANMETSLSNLQSQQAALGSFTPVSLG